MNLKVAPCTHREIPSVKYHISNINIFQLPVTLLLSQYSTFSVVNLKCVILRLVRTGHYRSSIEMGNILSIAMSHDVAKQTSIWKSTT